MSTVGRQDRDMLAESMRKMTMEAWGRGNLDVVDKVMAPDVVSHSSMGDVEGIEAYKAWITDMHESMSDVHVVLEDVIVEDDRAVGRYEVTGRHTGEFQGIPPTDEEVSFSGVVIARFEGGKCVEEWSYADMLTMLQQIGAIPESPTA